MAGLLGPAIKRVTATQANQRQAGIRKIADRDQAVSRLAVAPEGFDGNACVAGCMIYGFGDVDSGPIFIQ